MIADKTTMAPINMVSRRHRASDHQRRVPAQGPINPKYAVHDDVGEVYQVLEGAGTMLLGGKLTAESGGPPARKRHGQRGNELGGAKQVRIAKGDMLIPAGTPHRWMMAEEFTAYTVVRIDAEGVAPLLK